ncbi:MAG TPA: phage tail sheath family protein [Bacteroidetes bacterium]|nr:phage tail sheath family protein [Bacteroidota bacterium]
MIYKTPGVYVEEIPTFPPSVAQVETAIPAFIGYTEKAEDADGTAIATFPYVKRIKSILEYERFFGKANSQPMTVNLDADGLPDTVTIDPAAVSKYRMYYALRLFYANGGGPCYIISTGLINKTAESVAKADLIDKGLAALKKLDEPTLILFPDATGIDGPDEATQKADYHDVLKAALAQCAALGDRFLVCDLYDGLSIDGAAITTFRNGIGNNFLKYGAAYHPWLNTSLPYYFENKSIVFSSASATMDNKNLADILAHRTAKEAKELAEPLNTDVQAEADLATAVAGARKVADAAVEATTAIKEAPGSNGAAADTALADANQALTDIQDPAATLAKIKSASASALAAIDAAIAAAAFSPAVMNNILNNFFTNEFESRLATLLGGQRITMPPSPAVAGIYAMVDRTRGVWKAPANVSLNAVAGPAVKITDKDQESLNVDTTGKSVNAIRSFAGRGTMVWGARTLAGNDNEWRYVNVRRFFNMAEESIKKATEPFVFEPNDANTWVRVRAMIENFLVVQWRAGALAGATPEEAFYVQVGLGTTMTALDILEGRMNVEIGMAVVRPAEFIILKFSHKMAVS